MSFSADSLASLEKKSKEELISLVKLTVTKLKQYKTYLADAKGQLETVNDLKQQIVTLQKENAELTQTATKVHHLTDRNMKLETKLKQLISERRRKQQEVIAGAPLEYKTELIKQHQEIELLRQKVKDQQQRLSYQSEQGSSSRSPAAQDTFETALSSVMSNVATWLGGGSSGKDGTTNHDGRRTERDVVYSDFDDPEATPSGFVSPPPQRPRSRVNGNDSHLDDRTADRAHPHRQHPHTTDRVNIKKSHVLSGSPIAFPSLNTSLNSNDGSYADRDRPTQEYSLHKDVGSPRALGHGQHTSKSNGYHHNHDNNNDDDGDGDGDDALDPTVNALNLFASLEQVPTHPQTPSSIVSAISPSTATTILPEMPSHHQSQQQQQQLDLFEGVLSPPPSMITTPGMSPSDVLSSLYSTSSNTPSIDIATEQSTTRHSTPTVVPHGDSGPSDDTIQSQLSLQTQLDTMESQFIDLETSHRKQVQRYAEQLRAANETVEEYKTMIAENKTAMKQYEDKIDALQNTIAELTSDIDHYKSQNVKEDHSMSSNHSVSSTSGTPATHDNQDENDRSSLHPHQQEEEAEDMVHAPSTTTADEGSQTDDLSHIHVHELTRELEFMTREYETLKLQYSSLENSNSELQTRVDTLMAEQRKARETSQEDFIKLTDSLNQETTKTIAELKQSYEDIIAATKQEAEDKYSDLLARFKETVSALEQEQEASQTTQQEMLVKLEDSQQTTSGLQTTINHLESQIESFQTTNGLMKQNLLELQSKHEALQQELDAAVAARDVLTEDRQSVASQLATLQHHYQQVLQSSSTIQDDLQTKSSELDELKSQYTRLQSDYTVLSEERDTQVKSIENQRIQPLQEEIREYEAKVASLQATILSHEEIISRLELEQSNTRADLQQQIESLIQSHQQQLEKEIAYNKQIIDEMEARHDTARTALHTELTTIISQQEEKIEQLTTQLDQLKSIEDQYTRLTEKYQELKLKQHRIDKTGLTYEDLIHLQTVVLRYITNPDEFDVLWPPLKKLLRLTEQQEHHIHQHRMKNNIFTNWLNNAL